MKRPIPLHLLAGVLLFLLGVNSSFAAEPAAIPTKTVNSIAELRDVNPTNNQVVVVLDYYGTRSGGYFPAHRRGGGIFRWVTDLTGGFAFMNAEDGGLHITNNISTNGIWERVLNGEVPNVMMWGAKGDGDASGADTVAIKNAIAGMTYVGKHLFFPSGTYVITNTLVIDTYAHIEGESSENSTTIIMAGAGRTNRDVFRTTSADIVLHGNITALPNGYLTNSYGTADFSHGLIFENLMIQIGQTLSEYSVGGQTSAALCLSQAGDASVIRNIQVYGGGYGVRCIGGGTPGLRVEYSSFFDQSIAAVGIEGVELANGNAATGSGPVTLTGVAVDAMSSAQATTASALLFSNVWANVSLNDFSFEGGVFLTNGVIHWVMARDDAGFPQSTFKVNGGSFRCTSPQDLIVISSGSNATHTPLVDLEPFNAYQFGNLIRDEFGGRNIAAPSGSTQVPVTRPMQYQSRQRLGTARTTRLTIGDTAFVTFTPGTTNGWYRVATLNGNGSVIGGRLAINSLTESTEFEFHGDYNTDGWISPLRKSKNTGTTQTSPTITKARVITMWEANQGGVSGANGPRAVLEVYVDHALTDNTLYPYAEMKRVHLSVPVENRMQFLGEAIDLIPPIELIDYNPNSTARTNANETVWFSTGATSLLR